MGLALAEGNIMTWANDDGLYQTNALKNCIDLLNTLNKKDGITVRYYEGIDMVGQVPHNSYWVAHTHADLRLEGVPTNTIVAPMGMYYTEYFIEMGGWDTRFEHLNMNCHDFAIRSQKNGGQIYLSPDLVLIQDHCPGYTGDHGPIEDAYWKNDKQLFEEIYKNKANYENRIVIDFNNWKASAAVRKRRFKDE